MSHLSACFHERPRRGDRGKLKDVMRMEQAGWVMEGGLEYECFRCSFCSIAFDEEVVNK
jgi:hypothetical protein